MCEQQAMCSRGLHFLKITAIMGKVSRINDRSCPRWGMVRKVRASEGRMPDNVRWRRLQGQCNRKIQPAPTAQCLRAQVMVERQCKRLPSVRQRAELL